MSETTTKLDGRTVVSLTAMGGGIFLVANDFSALTVALRDVELELDATLNRAQWVINAYTLVFGVLIVTGGRLADQFGRRRMFFVGAAIFAASSLVSGAAPTIEVLIASRALMGAGGALMWPSTLGMTFAALPKERAGMAGAFIIGIAGMGNAMGPLVGGVLTDFASWRWIFLLNVPITALAIWAVVRFVPADSPRGAGRLDYRGMVTLSLATVLILVALDQGPAVGFNDPWVLATLTLGTAMFVVFVVVEAREGEAALVPAELVQNRSFAAAAVATLLMATPIFGVLLYVPQYTQKVLGWSAVQAGVGLLPVMLMFAVLSFLAGHVFERAGARLAIGFGASCLLMGVVWLAVAIGGSYRHLLPGLLLMGVGIAFFRSSLTTAAVTAVDRSQASLAGGVLYMCNVGGGAVGLALNTAVVLSGDSLSDGIRRAFVLDGALGLASAVLAVVVVRTAGTWHPHLVPHRRTRP